MIEDFEHYYRAVQSRDARFDGIALDPGADRAEAERRLVGSMGSERGPPPTSPCGL
jgi:hypothetical protein